MAISILPYQTNKTTTPFIPNYDPFDFFNSKFDHSSYLKNYANIVKFKSFLKNFY